MDASPVRGDDTGSDDLMLAGSGGCGPLTGIRVLEIGHFVAAPFCGRLLADLGADVIKIEPPSGDPVRAWGEQVDGQSTWWSVHGRNKRSVVIDLRHPQAAALVLQLVRRSDALIENFRPGHLQRLGLGPADLQRANPDLVVARISGFGQDGPHRDRAAFGVIGEAIGGLRHLTNQPPGPEQPAPVRTGISIGDSVAGLYAAFGVVASLLARRTGSGARGDVDVALTESVLSLMEGMLPSYGTTGAVRQPTGARIPTAAPSSAYPTRDGPWIVVAANSEPMFGRLADVIGLDLPRDPRFASNTARLANVEELDEIIARWTRERSVAELESELLRVDIPHTRILTAAEIAEDPQLRARGMVLDVSDPLIGSTLHPGAVPRIAGSGPAVRWTGPEVGAHTDEVLAEVGGMSVDALTGLRESGVLG